MPRHGTTICALCERDQTLTLHHLIPRTLHRNKWFRKNFDRETMNRGIDVCRDCHRAIHHFVPDEKDLGRNYNTQEALLDHDEIGNFVGWIRGRDTGVVSMPPRRRRKRGRR